MNTCITNYKLNFFLPWIVLYLIFPAAWALPVSVISRFYIFSGLLIYLSVSVYFVNRWFNSLHINAPFIMWPKAFSEHVRNNSGLVCVCSIAALLNIIYLFSPISMFGDEALHLQGGLWIYYYIGSYLHKYFQFIFLVLLIAILLTVRIKPVRKLFINCLNTELQGWGLNKPVSFIFILVTIILLIAYFYLLRNLPYNPFLSPMYPPAPKILYLISYYLSGINTAGPRIMQLIFYLLSAIYLYRTVMLFSNRDTALLGASVYLFSPLMFFYAHSGELHSGVIFFMVLVSFHFLKFLKYEDYRDLLLTSYFIGIGFLYKRDIFLMFFICTGYLFIRAVKNRELFSGRHLKILLTSLVPIIPWIIIGKFFTWRNYTIVWSHITSLDRLTAYFLLIASTMSWPIFFLFILSIVYVLLFKRDELSLFWGWLFIAYYTFYSIDMGALAPRLSTAFSPTIAVFISCFLYNLAKKSGKYSFKIIFPVLTVYLIFLCTMPAFNARYLGIDSLKLHKFPSADAMKWVKNNIKGKEKILTLRILPVYFYMDKYEITRDNVVTFWYEVPESVSDIERLKTFCNENAAYYIMFPYGPEYPFPVLKDLKENRSKEFLKVAEFGSGENYIYIYKLKIMPTPILS